MNAYVRWVGGDPSSYKGRVPAHLFPQWGFPLTGKLVEGLSYPMLAAMNGGCKLTINGAAAGGRAARGDRAARRRRRRRAARHPRSEDRHRHEVESGSGRRAPLRVRSAQREENGKDGKAKDKARVPVDAREIAFFKLGPKAGLDFAKLTGDFNPVHWVPRWARAFGFRNVILHGFGTMARAIEALNRGLFAGDVTRAAGDRRALHAPAGAAGARRRLRARQRNLGRRRAGRSGLPRRALQNP